MTRAARARRARRPRRSPAPAPSSCVAILLFLYIGKWLDAKLGTAPWLLMRRVCSWAPPADFTASTVADHGGESGEERRVKKLAIFAIVIAASIALRGVDARCSRFPRRADRHAIVVSAVIALRGAALLAFMVARAFATTNVVAGWGLGMLLRFVVLAIYALIVREGARTAVDRGARESRCLFLRLHAARTGAAQVMRFGTLLLSRCCSSSPRRLRRRETKSTYGPLGDHVIAGPAKNVDIITPHITDSHHLELPFVGEVRAAALGAVPRRRPHDRLSPTKHVLPAARGSAAVPRHHDPGGAEQRAPDGAQGTREGIRRCDRIASCSTSGTR